MSAYLRYFDSNGDLIRFSSVKLFRLNIISSILPTIFVVFVVPASAFSTFSVSFLKNKKIAYLIFFFNFQIWLCYFKSKTLKVKNVGNQPSDQRLHFFEDGVVTFSNNFSEEGVENCLRTKLYTK